MHGSFHWPRPTHDAVWPTCRYNQSQLVCLAARFRAWKCRHYNRPECKTLGRILKILCHKLLIFHILLKIQRSWWALVVTVVNTTAFFLEGVWHYIIFFFTWNIKEHYTHVSQKSCIIQPIRWRLRNSWSVSIFVCRRHQMFSKRSMDVMSEAETTWLFCCRM